MTTWQLLTTPHVMTAIALTAETILALAQLIVLAYWVQRWEKNNAAAERRFNESIEDGKHRFDETVKACRESERLLRETIERLNGAATPPSEIEEKPTTNGAT